MPRLEVGERVGAIMSADAEEVRLFGYGTYQGQEMPPEELGFPILNPKILLDSGDVVWGFECWWAEEDKIREMVGNRRVVEVSIETTRRVDREPEE